MSMKQNITIDGQEVPLRLCRYPSDLPDAVPPGYYKDLRDLEKGSIRMTRRIPTWICSLWKCLRTLPM